MSSSQDRMLNAKRGCALDDASMMIVSGVRQQHGRFEAAHVYITHLFYSGLQRTVWHSFARAISGNYEAGVADTYFRLA